jgi:hypothetical protein
MLGGFSTRLMDLFLTGSLEDIQTELATQGATEGASGHFGHER